MSNPFRTEKFMKKNPNNYVAIMAGGVGSRFWPVSRTSFPKQFLDILHTGKTLLQSTYERFRSFVSNDNIFIVTSEEYVSIVKNQLPGLPEDNIVAEPERKNTAPCIALISMKLYNLNPEANLIVAPSDHVIYEEEMFRDNCLSALNFTAVNNAFVTLGIKPTYANTGYGYIQFEKQTVNHQLHPVRRFTEKPDRETAVQFLLDGTFLWNSGIFIWKAKDILNAFRLHQPEMFQVFAWGLSELNTEREAAAIRQMYASCASVSIDYAILEKARNIYVIPAAFGWSDLGTWNSAWENGQKDPAQNSVAGENTLVVDARGCIVHSTDKKLVLVGGVEDLIVVNTPDALLICKKENEQEIKQYVARLKEIKGPLYL